jgi:hypothetical protein
MIYTSDPTAVDTYTGIEWTYKMDDGICTDSHALVTAAKFGLPVEVLNRAEALALHLDANIEEVGTYDETKASLEINGRLGLMDAARVAKEIIGDECNAVQIPPRWMPPPSLEGSSCLYVLEIGTNPPSLYVGETDALANRMAQHRKKGVDWAMMRAVAFKIEGGKSDSRHFESLLIRKLAKEGFDMVSIADGRLVRKRCESAST